MPELQPGLQRGYIDALPGLYDAIEFDFLRLPVEEMVKIAILGLLSPSAKRDFMVRRFVAASIASWTVRDPDGDPVPVSAESIGRLTPLLASRVIGIVLGFDEGDPPISVLLAELEAQTNHTSR